jgi:nitrate/nitrite-specific signal transduction histidine kinase
MEKLGTRIKVWSLVVFAVVILNSILGIHALKALHKSDLAFAESGETDLKIQKLREAISLYDESVLRAEVTGRQNDLKLKHDSEQLVSKLVSEDLKLALDANLEFELSELSSKINHLFKAPGITNHLLYQHKYEDLVNNADQVSAYSRELTQSMQKRNEDFYRRTVVLNLTFLLGSFFTIVFASLYLSRSVIRPVLQIIGVIQKVRVGDLSARVENLGDDEIREMGKNLNCAIQELEIKQQNLDGRCA